MRTIWAATLACLVIGGTVDAKRLHLRKPRHGFQMRMTPFVIPAGADREGCEYRTTPNRKAMDVQSFELRATPGTHHFVVWDYLGGDRNPSDFWTGIRYSPGCIGLGPQGSFASTANLFGMQAARSRVEFPPGIAVRLEPNAIVYPNLHFHNYSDKSVLGQAVFNFVAAPEGTVLHHAQALTVGTFQISIPPLSTAAVTGEWRTSMALNVIQLSTHQHRRGTLMSIHHIDAAGNDMGELVVSDNWEHPNVQWYPQALRLPAGEGLRFTCEWNNPDDHAVHFGPTSEDEMCFVTGYFYPDDESTPVTGPGCIPQGGGLECFVRKQS